MIKYSGPEFCFLTAAALKKAVIYDKGIDAVIISERFNRIGYLFGQKRRKTKPVDLRIIQKAVKGIF